MEQARPTKNQKLQQSRKLKTPKGVNKTKAKHSTPLANFNERAKLAAIQISTETNSMRRMRPTSSDSNTSNRSFLIFNTSEPQPNSKKVYNIEADSHDEQAYEIITSNNREDFMEVSHWVQAPNHFQS